MSQDQDLATRGIAAYEAGDKQEAAQLLAQAVKVERDNPQAWFTLAQLVRDPQKKKQCLQMTLRLAPDHAEAKAQLDALSGSAETNTPAAESPKPKSKRAARSFSTPLLTEIPGAPERLSVEYIGAYIRNMATDSVAVLTGRQASEDEADQTWWNVFFPALLISFATGLAFSIRLLFWQSGEFFDPPLIRYIYYPVIVSVVGPVAFGAGALASHWVAMRYAAGKGSLLSHAYASMRVWAPASFSLAILAILSGIITDFRDGYTLTNVFFNGFYDLGGGAIITTVIAAGIAGYAGYLIAQSMAAVHSISTGNAWIVSITMLAVTSLIFL